MNNQVENEHLFWKENLQHRNRLICQRRKTIESLRKLQSTVFLCQWYCGGKSIIDIVNENWQQEKKLLASVVLIGLGGVCEIISWLTSHIRSLFAFICARAFLSSSFFIYSFIDIRTWAMYSVYYSRKS